MVVACPQCGAKFKLTVKKKPVKPIVFKCSKCSYPIRMQPEEVEALERAGITPPKKERAAAPAMAGTAVAVCTRCGASFVKPASEKTTICHQCRIDSLVAKVREKYGVEAPPPPAPTERVSRYTIRTADGLVLGPIKLHTVTVLAREKRIKGVEEVSKDGSEYRPLMSYPELADIFPELKEIMDTTGLEEKVEEAFMSAFKEEEEEKAEAVSSAPPPPEEMPLPPPAEREPSPLSAESLLPGEPPPPEPTQPSPEELKAAEEALPAPAESLAEPLPQPETMAEHPLPPEPPLVETEIEFADTNAVPEEAPLGMTELMPEVAESPISVLAEEEKPQTEEAPVVEMGVEFSAPLAEIEATSEVAAGPPAEAEERAPVEGWEAEAEEIAPPPPSGEEAAPHTLSPPAPAESEEEEAVIDWSSVSGAGEEGREQEALLAAESSPAAVEGDGLPVGEEWSGEPGEEEEEEEIIEGLTPIEEPTPDMRYRIRYPDGLILGPIKLGTIKELLESGNLTGQEDIQRGEELWAPFSELPELAELVAAPPAEEEDVIELTDVVEEQS